jgi:glycosyltransferase involved in cell wall biosynthesis
LRRWKTDVVLSQGFHSQCYGGPAARIAGTRNVFWCHNLLPSGGVIDDPIVRLALRMAADTVIGAPESNLVNLQRYYATRCPVRLVYPAHPMEEFKRGDGARIRRELGIDHHTPLAMIVSRLQRGKGQDVFIRAAARVAHQLPTVRFVIVGGTAMPGDSAYEAELKRMAGEAGLANRVIFTGERHDVPDLLAAADVFVMASTAPEMFGLALGEAMAAGKAVIATKAGGPAEIVENGQSGLLTAPGNDEELAAALLRVFSDDSLREQLQRNAVVRFESRFSFERMSAELSCVLRDAAASRARAGANRLPAPTAGRAE